MAQPVVPTVLITGGSSGIGYELARQFAARSARLVLVARGQGGLDQAQAALERDFNADVTVFANDLSKPEAADELVDALARRGLDVDILVNNAGFATYGNFSDTSWSEERAELQVNVVALTHLTKLLLPPMLARRHGRILNVASTAAFQPGPSMAVYYATKAYVLSFSQALSSELEGTGVTVTALCPGPTRSGFQSRARMQQARLVRRTLMTPDDVARAAYRGLMRGRRLVVPGWQNQLLRFGVWLTPTAITLRVVRWAHQRASAVEA